MYVSYSCSNFPVVSHRNLHMFHEMALKGWRVCHSTERIKQKGLTQRANIHKQSSIYSWVLQLCVHLRTLHAANSSTCTVDWKFICQSLCLSQLPGYFYISGFCLLTKQGRRQIWKVCQKSGAIGDVLALSVLNWMEIRFCQNFDASSI